MKTPEKTTIDKGMNRSFKIKFWGVRGSYPVPGNETLFYGGNTPCVEIQAGERTVILDAGTGLVGLGRALVQSARQHGKDLDLVMLFSHLHLDHLQGFPFFAPVHFAGTQLHLYGPGELSSALAAALDQTVAPPYFPLSLKDLACRRNFAGLSDAERLVWGEGAPEVHTAGDDLPATTDALTVRTLCSSAHPGGVQLYRLTYGGRSVVYASDIEVGEEPEARLVEFVRKADLLILDAQYSEAHYRGTAPGFPSTRGWGHSTVPMACELARRAGVRQLALFHFEPRYSDAMLSGLETQARRHFSATFAAREGLELELACKVRRPLSAISQGRRIERKVDHGRISF